ncbi:hypothetical protein HMPREF1991_02932 [Hoylesella loescheii DSM 19665 = JCM 12249 = ATCC 15930]|uniref:Uncharacterized protein n=1 Tax=Hoylesella loescheii DSM 19665 = JCM 12249 = ATCC 15930 TaxID=1122985 RepID=A0A069QEA9_HOYLO|nr:hypothetical protein HMPREF1991_02932 [Hoylesella loescheii DSM 19665 = JCM 12249 = ATCC 15930]
MIVHVVDNGATLKKNRGDWPSAYLPRGICLYMVAANGLI